MYKPTQEVWDYNTTYSFALKILSKQACSQGKLRKRLNAKTSPSITEDVIQALMQQNMLDDEQLCLDSALHWVTKKPISRIQLYQKLLQYGFESSHINYAFTHLEKLFDNKSLEIVGSFSLSQLLDIYPHLFSMSIWEVLMLSSCIHICTIHNAELDVSKVLYRLKLKGYSISPSLREIIETIIEKTQNNEL